MNFPKNFRWSKRNFLSGEEYWIFKCEITGYWTVRQNYDKTGWEALTGTKSCILGTDTIFESPRKAKSYLKKLYSKTKDKMMGQKLWGSVVKCRLVDSNSHALVWVPSVKKFGIVDFIDQNDLRTIVVKYIEDSETGGTEWAEFGPDEEVVQIKNLDSDIEG